MRWTLGCVLVLGGCVVNGKGYGPGAGAPAATSASQGTGVGPAEDRADLYTADGRVREDARYYKEQGYATAPADPWAAVAGDAPVRWPTSDRWVLRETAGTCTARQDHCLVGEAWFVIDNARLQSAKQRRGAELIETRWQVFGGTEFMSPANTTYAGLRSGDITAYRTVPATRGNLVPGVIAIGLSREDTVPDSARASYESAWTYGIVEEVDVDLGVYRLQGEADTRPLAGARVAVLAWRPGARVEILGGKSRDGLAVRAADVFLPE